VTQLEKLRDDTLLYPGHEYLANNLRFTLDREPDNLAARKMLETYGSQDPANAHITSLEEEREINVFFRLRSPMVIGRLREAFPELDSPPDERTVFLKLRELRNSW
jgi:hydroxyacylglutathione hydrolase